MDHKIVTIKQAAQQLDPAETTVCQVLKNETRFKQSPWAKILDAASKLVCMLNGSDIELYKMKPSTTERKKVTIYDIAAKLRVSPSTVSRALNKSEKVAEDTISMVQETAKAMNYLANVEARELRAKNIGLANKNVTIYSIASQLRLSPSTVSRAFAKKSKISDETRAIILAKAGEMGYIPDAIAKKLRISRDETDFNYVKIVF